MNSLVAAGSDLRHPLYKRLWTQKYLLAMALPGVLFMIIFNYIPMTGIIIAFKEYDITGTIFSAPWVGFDNFREFFADDRFFLVFRNSICISLLKFTIGFPLPIMFAILLNELAFDKFKRVVQTVSYLPHFLSWVIVGGISINWLSDAGMLTDLLVKTQVISEPVNFLGMPQFFWQILVISDQWKELGWGAIIYLAAITSIDTELYEAARVDGAGRLRRIWHITLPGIKGTIAVMMVLSIGYLLYNNFDQLMVLSNPLNYDSSDVIETYVYRIGMKQARYSFATSIGLFKSVISLMLILLANFLNKKLTDSSLF